MVKCQQQVEALRFALAAARESGEGLQEKVSTLQNNMGHLEGELVATRMALSQLEKERAQATTQLQECREEVARLQGQDEERRARWADVVQERDACQAREQQQQKAMEDLRAQVAQAEGRLQALQEQLTVKGQEADREFAGWWSSHEKGRALVKDHLFTPHPCCLVLDRASSHTGGVAGSTT